MEMIKAAEDYYGEPGFGSVYINPNYIISISHIGEHKDSYNNTIREHYVVDVDYKDQRRTFHITYIDGQKLLGRD